MDKNGNFFHVFSMPISIVEKKNLYLFLHLKILKVNVLIFKLSSMLKKCVGETFLYPTFLYSTLIHLLILMNIFWGAQKLVN